MFGLLFSPFTRFFHLILGVGTAQNFPPPLDGPEEEQTFDIFRHHPDAKTREDARQKLILHNLRLVSHIVRKYYASNPSQEDLVSIGTIGLCKAIDTFKIDAGIRFATYGAKCIQNEILMYFRARRKLCNEVSLNDTIDVDRDGNPLTYTDVISSDECVTEEVFRKVEAERAMTMLHTRLDARERQVIMMRFGLNDAPAMTQREVATQLGISRSYVSRIEKAAIGKLREGFGIAAEV